MLTTILRVTIATMFIALSSVSTAHARQWYSLNIIVYSTADSSRIAGATVAIDQDFGNGTLRNSDGSGFTNFGVQPSTISYTASASGFATNTGSIAMTRDETVFIGLTPEASGGGGSPEIPAVTTFTNQNLVMKFWNDGSTGTVIQGWLEFIDNNSTAHGWMWVWADRATGQTQRGQVYLEGSAVPAGWRTYVSGNPNWLAGAYSSMGAPARYWGVISCGNGDAINRELLTRFGWAFAEGGVVFLGGIIASGGVNVPGAGAAGALVTLFQMTKALWEMEASCRP
jgi:hypothetical protein